MVRSIQRQLPITVWVAADGKEFQTQAEAEAYDATLDKREVAVRKYVDSRQPYDKYPPDLYGVWEVRGEDPNCDFGGHHHNPFIGIYQGTYIEVVREVIDHKNFFTWGWGGNIKPYNKKIKVLSQPKG